MNREIPTGELIVILMLASVLIYFADDIRPVLVWSAIIIFPVSAIYHILRWYFKSR